MKIVPKTKITRTLQGRTAGRRRKLAGEVAKAAAVGALRNDMAPAYRIEMMALAEIAPARRRVRKSGDEHLAKVMASLRRFGPLPILVDREGRIIDGHVVAEAARALGLSQIPVIRVEHLTENEARLLSITLNRLQELGEWDTDALALEFFDLEIDDTPLTITGFDQPQIDILLAGEIGLESDAAEDIDEPDGVAVSRPGDLWLLGKHRILCGSSIDAVSYERLMAGATAQAVFADPPYNCPIEGFVGGLGQHKHKDFAMGVGEMSAEQFTDFLTQFMQMCRGALIEGGVFYACMDWRQIDKLMAAGHRSGFHHINTAVWYKGSGGMGSLYRSAHEQIAVFCSTKTPAINNVELGRHGRDRTNVWTYPGANRRGSSAANLLSGHPTPKPVELVADAMRDVTDRGGIVLDPFLGSGTTIIAAERAGRIGYGIELDPLYVDLAVRRWQKMTGMNATLGEDGQSFDDVCAGRLNEPEESN